LLNVKLVVLHVTSRLVNIIIAINILKLLRLDILIGAALQQFCKSTGQQKPRWL